MEAMEPEESIQQLPKPTRFAKTQAELMTAIKITPNTLHKYKAEGCPVNKTAAGYNVDAIQSWMDEHGKLRRRSRENAQRSLDDQKRLLKAQADEREAKAELARLKAETEQGLYIPLSEVQERDKARISAVRRGLLRLPKTVAPIACGLTVIEIEKLVERKVRDLLTKFAEM